MTDTMLSKEEFWAKLQAARKPAFSGGHPFSNAWKAGQLSKAQLGFWAMQHYYYIEEVTQMFAGLLMRLPDLDARLHMLENLNGEEFPDRHPDLLLRFAEACGMSPERVKNAYNAGEVLPSTMAMRPRVSCSVIAMPTCFISREYRPPMKATGHLRGWRLSSRSRLSGRVL